MALEPLGLIVFCQRISQPSRTGPLEMGAKTPTRLQCGNGLLRRTMDRQEYDSDMGTVSKWFRFTAVMLLLLIGTEMATCELPNSPCSVVSIAAKVLDSGAHKIDVSRHSATSRDSDDDCICCCAHTLVQASLALLPVRLTLLGFTVRSIGTPILFPSDIERPPQLA